MIKSTATTSSHLKETISALPDPEGVGSASPDPKGAGLATSDPPAKGFASPDPRGVGSVSPSPLEGILPRPTWGLRTWPRAGASSPAWAHIAPNHYGRRMWTRDHALMLGRGRTRPNVTDGHDRPYLGTHVSNSAGWTSTVQLKSPCDSSQGGMLTIPYARTGRGAMTGWWRLPVALVTDRVATCSRLHYHLQDQQDVLAGGEGRRSPRAPFLLVFLFLLFLSLSCNLSPSLGL
jgi:hypothetical protein